LLKNETSVDPIHSKRILEERFIEINGIEQWVTIKGESSKPVILFLHGGPGSPISPYASALYGEWEKDFIIVQWDQRGTGRTFGRNAPAGLNPEYIKSNPLSVEQMTADGIELTEYLTKYLGKQKIILFGSSWGSILGVMMAVKRPNLFYAYVGHSQIVDPSKNLVYDYQKIYKIVQNARDQKSMDILRSLGPPLYDTARNSGQLFRIIKKYEKKNSIPAPDSMWKISPSYDNAKDEQDRSDGDDYSFVNYVGDKRLGVKPMMATVDMIKDGLDFKMAVYLIQGEEDILTPKEITKEYFNKIRAPKKEYQLLPNTAHEFNLSVIAMQYRIMKSISCQ
jgi:pimeloyl-ACP methyl ester carboxylesterase